MERMNFGYSVKNIPTPNQHTYKLQLIEKMEAVIKRMRWKAIFYNPGDPNMEDNEAPQTYGLKSNKCPKQVAALKKFEADVINIAANIKFRDTTNDFQKKMKKDLGDLRKNNKVLTPADKTSNHYWLTKDDYKKIKMNAITANYKKGNAKMKQNIDKIGAKFAKKAGVLERMHVNGTNSCFVTLKDHKENFANNPKTRLINPAKNEVGRISKVILDKINKALIESLNVKQWKNTTSVINWFKEITEKHRYTFVMFDIKDFYPSISESLLKEALNFAKTILPISASDERAILHARKSLLFDENQVWLKKRGGLFDVTMGAFDGAEICELVGTYLLSLIGEKYNKDDVGLYRDDGLAIFKDTSGPQNERIKKDFQKIFREKGLEIVIECNRKSVDYLDVTMNLADGSFKPYHKPGDETNYIHADSDHPPCIIKQLPQAVEKRISDLSSTEEIFNEAKQHYQDALKKSGHNYALSYKPSSNQGRRRNRGRKIIWFNPPFSHSVETNVGKEFLRLLDLHFPAHDPLHKIFNRQTVKVSYGCMPSVQASINTHNKKILEETKPLAPGNCNCQNPDECPMPGECTTPNILYEATITTDLPNYGEKIYKGISEPPFKNRYGNHKKSFSHQKYKSETCLSTEIWRIKNLGGTPIITWRPVKQYPGFNPTTGRCALCLNEKLAILNHQGPNLINKRDEIVSTCRHRRKFLLAHLTSEA